MMRASETTRLPPELIVVPPPSLPAFHYFRWLWIAFLVMLLIFGGFLLFMQYVVHPGVAARNPNVSPWLLRIPTWVAIAGLCGILLIAIPSLFAHHRRFKRKEDDATRDDDDAKPRHPAAVELAMVWQQSRRLPKLDVIQDCLKKHAPSPNTDGRIVVLGDLDLPEIGDVFFEPEVVTPTEMAWNRPVTWGAGGAVFVAVGVLQYLGVIPIPGYHFLTQGLVWGLFAVCVWLWKSGVRPTYLRLAPGIVELLRFPALRKNKPRIRSYPIDGRTLVVVTKKLNQPKYLKMDEQKQSRWQKKMRKDLSYQSITVTLIRDAQKDVIPLANMRRKAQVLAAFWRAILSTAKRPNLSDEVLAG